VSRGTGVPGRGPLWREPGSAPNKDSRRPTVRSRNDYLPTESSAVVAAVLPSSEGELARMVPAANRPGSFPEGDLAAGEKIIFETRPRFIGLHPALFYGSLPFVLFFGLIASLGIYQVGIETFGPAAAFVMILVLIPDLYCAYSWSHTSYVVTNQRVMSQSGDSVTAAGFDEIQRVDLASSGVVFELTPSRTDPGSEPGRPRTLRWVAVPNAPAVVPFLQSAVAFYRIQQKGANLEQRMVAAEASSHVTCPYCGTLIETDQISLQDPHCPSCTAPLFGGPPSA